MNQAPYSLPRLAEETIRRIACEVRSASRSSSHLSFHASVAVSRWPERLGTMRSQPMKNAMRTTRARVAATSSISVPPLKTLGGAVGVGPYQSFQVGGRLGVVLEVLLGLGNEVARVAHRGGRQERPGVVTSQLDLGLCFEGIGLSPSLTLQSVAAKSLQASVAENWLNIFAGHCRILLLRPFRWPAQWWCSSISAQAEAGVMT